MTRVERICFGDADYNCALHVAIETATRQRKIYVLGLVYYEQGQGTWVVEPYECMHDLHNVDSVNLKYILPKGEVTKLS